MSGPRGSRTAQQKIHRRWPQGTGKVEIVLRCYNRSADIVRGRRGKSARVRQVIVVCGKPSLVQVGWPIIINVDSTDVQWVRRSDRCYINRTWLTDYLRLF